MSKSLVDTFIAIENKTFMKVSYADEDRLRIEIRKRLYEIMGMIEMARLMGADKKFIMALERQVGWLIRRRNEAQ